MIEEERDDLPAEAPQPPDPVLNMDLIRCAELTESLKRERADFLNYKRHAEGEREERRIEARATALMLLLPVQDDLDLALASVPPELAEQPWVKGVALIAGKFHNILKGQGVTPIAAIGEAFNPRFHESVHQEPGPEGIVTRELRRGYRIGERVIRPAQVAVGNGTVEEGRF